MSDYPGPAGGWPALGSVSLHLQQQGIPIKGARTLLATNQPDGFDCPGCAWPDRNHQSSFQFCENGAKAVAAEATAHRATPERIGEHTVTELASWSDFDLENLGRLTEPLRFDAATDRYRRCTWDEAFALIGQTLRALPSPDAAAFYTSGRTSNEAAFLYQLFVRRLGTNNFPDCSNMCHEPSGVGLKRTVGVGKGTVSLEDFEQADAIFSFGHNPGTNHPRMLGELRQAAKRGARIVAFNPLRERGLERFADPQDKLEMLRGGSTPIASHYYPVRVGGDAAVLTALCKGVLERGAEDRAFIAEHTTGFDAFSAFLSDTPWERLVALSGLTRAQLDEACDVYCQAERTIICWGMGITQHRHGVANVELIAALLMLRGQIGRPGAGICPIRGHSNVQGDRTMGIDEKPGAAFLDRLGRTFDFTPPRQEGLGTVDTIAAMLDGRVQVFVAMGGNFAAAAPDTERTAEALRRCRLTVHVATKLNRSHVVHGQDALVLPCLGRTELDLQRGESQAVTVEDSMSQVHLSRGRNAPASEHLLSEPMIVARMAVATLQDDGWPWMDWASDYARIRDLIAQVFPDFHDFNARGAGPGGFRLPNSAAQRRWATPEGRAVFRPQQLAAQELAPGQMLLSTLRSHDQYNTTVYGLNDRYRGVRGERRVLFMHPEDIQALGLSEGNPVDLEAAPRPDGRPRRASGFRVRSYDI
ncbi:MAG: FdhF/YdeP family oxidoreductase, partial [Rubrivivax sp.]